MDQCPNCKANISWCHLKSEKSIEDAILDIKGATQHERNKTL